MTAQPLIIKRAFLKGLLSLTFVVTPVQSFFVFSINYFSLSSLPVFFSSTTPLKCIKDVSEIDGWNVSSLYDDELLSLPKLLLSVIWEEGELIYHG